MKKYIKYVIIGVLIALSIITVGNIVKFKNDVDTLKKDLLNERNSDDKILVSKIKDETIKIELLEKVIKNNISELNNKRVVNICNKTQLDRLMNGVEYNINYCTGNNLKQFEDLK